MRLHPAILVGAIVLFGSLPAFGKESAIAVEAKGKAEIAGEIAAFVTACATGGAKSEAIVALDEAKALAPGSAAIAAAETLLGTVAEDAPTAAAASAAAKKIAAPRIAKVYDRLALVEHDPKDAARFDRYLFAAIRWESTKSRLSKAQKAVDDAARANRTEDAGRNLVALRRADPEGAAAGRYDRIELDLAAKDVCLVGSPTNELVAWVSLPRDWTKGRSYPVLVGVDGAGSNFLGYARGSKGARGSRPVIVVAPCTLSNTNALEPAKYPMYDPALLGAWDGKRIDFDGPGVDGVIEAVRARFGGEEKVFVTGFSGGGNYTYWKLLHDPAHVRGAAPACANFSGLGAAGSPGAGVAGGPVVELLTGEKDPYREQVAGAPGIEAQTDAAAKTLAELGFTHVTRIMVPGAGHDPFHGRVYDLIDRVLGGK